MIIVIAQRYLTSYLQHLPNTRSRAREHRLDVSRNGAWRWDPVPRAPGLHQRQETRIANDGDGPRALRHPLNHLNSVHIISGSSP